MNPTSVSSVSSCKKFLSIPPHLWLVALLLLAIHYPPSTIHGATITGNLVDLSLSPLNTKLLFWPTNTVLITDPGLSAGPPKIIESPAGSFSVVLDAGDYTVSLPLIPTRSPFRIAVPPGSATINITNLMSTPATYIYTNTPPANPLHVNTTDVTVLGSAGESTLLDSVCSIPANTLTAGRVLVIEAFGSYADPDNNQPQVTLTIKLGSTTLLAESKQVGVNNWHLRAMVTIRSSGSSGSSIASMFVQSDDPGAQQFNCDSQSATINTTISQALDLTATVQDFSGSEAITCTQLLITIH